MGGMSEDDFEGSGEDDTAAHENAEERDDPGHEDAELLRKLKGWETSARSHWSRWRKEAERCYAFVAGDQWTSEDKSTLIDQMRQPIVFNRTGPMVDAVTGAEILNRQQVRYSPREMGDVQVNEVISAAAEWARDQCDAEDEESDAFHDVIVCGLGWTETRMEYERDAEGMVQVDRIDPLEVWSDPSSSKRNLADRRYQFRAHWKQKEDLPKEWRKKLEEAGAEGDGEYSSGMTHRPRGDAYDDSEDLTKPNGEVDRKRVWIRHFQWWELEDAYKIADPQTGKVAVLDADKAKAMALLFMKNGMRPPETVKIKQRKYREAWLAGSVILESRDIACKAFTFNAITGKRDRNNGTFFGIVRAMMDPQMWANKWLSQILHILNTSAKGGLLYETDAFVNPRKALDEWAKPDGAIEVKRGALSQGAIEERKAANYPNGIANLMEFAVNSMPQVTGINLELLGLVQKEQAGVLEAQRKQAGYAILAVFFDALRRYRKMQGRVMLHYIQHYMSDGRLIRIMGENGNEQYVPLLRKDDVATYDVIVDDAPMSANQKEAVWGMMTQLMPMLSKQPVPAEVWSELLRYSPLPSSLSAKISKAISGPDEPTPEQQAQQALMGLEVEQKKADVQKTQAEAAKVGAEAQAAGADGQLQQFKVQADAAARQQEMQQSATAHQQTMTQAAQAHEQKRAMAVDAHAMKMLQAAAQAKAKAQQPGTPQQ